MKMEETSFQLAVLFITGFCLLFSEVSFAGPRRAFCLELKEKIKHYNYQDSKEVTGRDGEIVETPYKDRGKKVANVDDFIYGYESLKDLANMIIKKQGKGQLVQPELYDRYDAVLKKGQTRMGYICYQLISHHLMINRIIKVGKRTCRKKDLTEFKKDSSEIKTNFERYLYNGKRFQGKKLREICGDASQYRSKSVRLPRRDG